MNEFNLEKRAEELIPDSRLMRYEAIRLAREALEAAAVECEKKALDHLAFSAGGKLISDGLYAAAKLIRRVAQPGRPTLRRRDRAFAACGAEERGVSEQRIGKADWQWFGLPGHFICARWCRFHLCTKVGNYLVSTVGEYVHPRHGKGSEIAEAQWLEKNWPGEEIGLDRKYETMVFQAGATCATKECGCGLPSIDGSELDSAGYNERAAAQAGHYAMCEKWSVPSPREVAAEVEHEV